MNVPVLLIGFNRPREFFQTLKNLKEIGITDLYISLDGPRDKNFNDKSSREEILKIVDDIQWCKIHLNLLPKNYGCKKAVNDAITWFFSKVEFGIINEDDVILNKQFFADAEYLLHKYENDNSVLSISAHSEFSSGKGMTHFLSPFCRVWGWATWRDSWNSHKDSTQKMQNMNFMSVYIRLPKFIKSFRIAAIINASKQGRLSTWDYEWNISHILLNSKSITPYGNYVINIGCNDLNATHTGEMESPQLHYSISSFRKKIPVVETNEIDEDMQNLIRHRCQMEPQSLIKEIRSILGIFKRAFISFFK